MSSRNSEEMSRGELLNTGITHTGIEIETTLSLNYAIIESTFEWRKPTH